MILMPEQNKKKNIFNPNRIQDVQRENPFAKISDIVYDILAEAILSTSILPGSKLNIASIAEQLQVSRTPVFTAIERLKESGLVIESYETGKYRSYYVLDISNESLSDLFMARKAIETTAAAICASNVALVDIEKLKKLAKDFQTVWSAYATDSTAAPPFSEREAIDKTFHDYVVLSTGNKYLIDMYQSLREPLSYLSVRTCEFVASKKERENLLILSSQHISICRAIESGFPETARLAMEKHIDFCHHRCLMDR